MNSILCRNAFLVGFMLLSSIASAGSALDESTVKRLIAASSQLETLEDKYPDVMDADFGLDSFADGGKAFVAHLASTPAYGGVKSIAKENGFKSVEDLFSTLFRVFLAKMAVEVERHPEMAAMWEGANVEKFRAQMAGSGMPEEVVAQQMKQMEAMLKLADSAKKAPEADKAFVRNNSKLISQLTKDSEEDEGYEEAEE